MKIKNIGVAGVPSNFKGKLKDFFAWLKSNGLNAYEIQCTFGFKLTPESIEYYKTAKENGIALSMHGPYYINLGSQRDEVVMASLANIKQGVKLAQEFDCERIIFHPGGGYGKTDEERKIGIEKLIDGLNNLEKEFDFKNVKLYPEIGGKTIALGSLDEIIYICQKCKVCYPCIDIAHLHARTNGSLKTKNDIINLFEKLKNNLPEEKFKNVHFHAYTINYGSKGEIKHLYHGDKYLDGRDGEPNLVDFVDVLKTYDINTWIISEAYDSQDLGAIYIKNLLK